MHLIGIQLILELNCSRLVQVELLSVFGRRRSISSVLCHLCWHSNILLQIGVLIGTFAITVYWSLIVVGMVSAVISYLDIIWSIQVLDFGVTRVDANLRISNAYADKKYFIVFKTVS